MSVTGTTPEGFGPSRKPRDGCGRCSGAWRSATIWPIICCRRISISTGASATVSRVRDILVRPDARVLDLACGTGDLLIALERVAGRELIGSDFCHPMLAGARRSWAGMDSGLHWWNPMLWLCHLPMPASISSPSLSAIAIWRTIARGWRRCGACFAPAARLRFLNSASRPTRLFCGRL